jgi:hypothetical protein
VKKMLKNIQEGKKFSWKAKQGIENWMKKKFLEVEEKWLRITTPENWLLKEAKDRRVGRDKGGVAPLTVRLVGTGQLHYPAGLNQGKSFRLSWNRILYVRCGEKKLLCVEPWILCRPSMANFKIAGKISYLEKVSGSSDSEEHLQS